MFRRARELGPSVLVPLAWTVVAAAHVGLVSEHALFVAHVVMSVLLAGFAVTGRTDMREGVLLVWWRIIAVGLLVTLAGTVGFVVEPGGPTLQAVALGGWMLLPAVGFVATGRRLGTRRWVYRYGALCCGLGAGLYGGGLLTGSLGVSVLALGIVGVGQTAGILDAALR